ncbi:MAG: hypothetical protein COA32_05920 [Fluviicola sp.]|nr:MAG: hypothetical protein COA32_05920 [Fluviicola sp.]
MKLTVLIASIVFIFNFSIGQESAESVPDNSKNTEKTEATESKRDITITKADLIGTWRACGDAKWDETADTLTFQHPTPDCRDNDCGEHNWSFRETGSVEFIFTDGCDIGFHSVSKNPKRWIFVEKDNRIKMITNDGYVEYFDILSLDEKLVLLHRKDLELE